MSRNTTERSRYKKYDYKTHHSTFTQRSENHSVDPPTAPRKTSAFKLRKDPDSFVLPPDIAQFDDIRLPLGEIFENSAKVARALINPPKDGRSLRNRNAELEVKLGKQAKEMEELRTALENMRGLLTAQMGEEAANHGLQARCEAQEREMAQLRREVDGLKSLAIMAAENSAQLQESNVSRRAEYRQNYEEVASCIPHPPCDNCHILVDELKQLRGRLQAEAGRSRALEERVLGAQGELEHKEKCIDYLRTQLEQYERRDRQQLEDSAPRRQTRGYVRSKPDEPFNSFSEFRY